MAGGPHAAFAACVRCAGKAERVTEGAERDGYRCTQGGCEFHIPWGLTELPKKPCWPPDPDYATAIREFWRKRRRKWWQFWKRKEE
jgi:hypothetical protein